MIRYSKISMEGRKYQEDREQYILIIKEGTYRKKN